MLCDNIKCKYNQSRTQHGRASLYLFCDYIYLLALYSDNVYDLVLMDLIDNCIYNHIVCVLVLKAYRRKKIRIESNNVAWTEKSKKLTHWNSLNIHSDWLLMQLACVVVLCYSLCCTLIWQREKLLVHITIVPRISH